MLTSITQNCSFLQHQLPEISPCSGPMITGTNPTIVLSQPSRCCCQVRKHFPTDISFLFHLFHRRFSETVQRRTGTMDGQWIFPLPPGYGKVRQRLLHDQKPTIAMEKSQGNHRILLHVEIHRQILVGQAPQIQQHTRPQIETSLHSQFPQTEPGRVVHETVGSEQSRLWKLSGHEITAMVLVGPTTSQLSTMCQLLVVLEALRRSA